MIDNTEHIIERQEFDLRQIKLKGKILDIGGGGEGVIGRMYENSVISIDLRKEELEDAPCDTIKIVMDAADLQFTDKCFDTACCFLTFMYIRKDNWDAVFAETYRVLKDAGEFHIWDVNIPTKPAGGESFFIVPTSILLPDSGELRPGYGVLWETHIAELEEYIACAKRAGFTIAESQTMDQAFYLKLVK
jgi:ubiquinone/menaquinone biosynthesis C-methylase UbiE